MQRRKHSLWEKAFSGKYLATSKQVTNVKKINKMIEIILEIFQETNAGYKKFDKMYAHVTVVISLFNEPI